MAQSRRTSSRTNRRTSQAKPGGRREPAPASARASRSPNSRRDSSESDRRSARQGRGGRNAAPDNRLYIFGGVGGAALLLVIIVAAASGERQTAHPKPRKTNVSPVATSSPIDWYTRGVFDGRDWAARARARHQEISADTVNEIAERMPSNYANKGIDAAGEQRFMQGFKDGAYGK